jgi:hypothetical protein
MSPYPDDGDETAGYPGSESGIAVRRIKPRTATTGKETPP